MLVNPISFRLSASIFWNSTWNLYKNNNYKYLFCSDIIFFEFFIFFFRKVLFIKFLDSYPIHFRLYRIQDKIIINLYYHAVYEHLYEKVWNSLLKRGFLKCRFKKFKKKEKLKLQECNEELQEVIFNKKNINYSKFKKILMNYKKDFNIKKIYNKKIQEKKKKKRKKKIKKRKLIKRLIKKIKKKIEKLKKLNTFKKIKKIIGYNMSKIDLFFLYKINFLKFIYNQKFWIFNYYYYFLSKILMKESNNVIINGLKKLELNIFRITTQVLKAHVVSTYIERSLAHRYSIYETMRPVLVDLKQRMHYKNIGGFKIAVTGRFKRALRATYWWRKDGLLFTATQRSNLDYSSTIHRSKYGTCNISVWLIPGLKGFGASGGLQYTYPATNPFFFILKKDNLLKINYFILKINKLFFSNLLKKKVKILNVLNGLYIKSLISCLLNKYIYLNMFLKSLIIHHIKKKKISKNIKRIFLPQYCKYKIFLEDFTLKNIIKIVPFIKLRWLKRLNLRSSYKINFLNKSKFVKLNFFKYKIYLF